MKLDFIKMQGCGNSYIYIDCFNREIKKPSALAKKLSNVYYGIGSDGLILIEKSESCHAKMRIFNKDGSEGKMCGNGIRCVCKYLYEEGIAPYHFINIETKSGEKSCFLFAKNGKADKICVDMGMPNFAPDFVTTKCDAPFLNVPLKIKGKIYFANLLSLGNEHCVIFVNKICKKTVNTIGAALQRYPAFTGGVNVEFVHVIDSEHIEVSVYEKGSGETMSCGSGASAAVCVCAVLGKCDIKTNVFVKLNGGVLQVNFTGRQALLTGDAKVICRGSVEI